MGILTKGMGAILKKIKPEAAYKVPKATNPDTIKLDKQLKTIKKIGAGTVGAIGTSAVYGKVKKNKKKKDKK
jgi:hypothetical protein